MLQTLIAFVLVFGIIVLIHEFGHYYFAQRAGVLVREFSIGFGPKLFSFRRGETTFTIRLLPLGGYVMMAGYEEEEDLRPGLLVGLKVDEDDYVEEIHTDLQANNLDLIPLVIEDFDLLDLLTIQGRLDDDRAELHNYSVKRDALIIEENGIPLQIAPRDRRIQNAPVLDKMITNFAGPLNNFILGIILFIVVAFGMGGVPTNQPVVGNVIENTPADQADLQAGDTILTIEGIEIETFDQAQILFQDNPENELTLEIERSGNTEEVNLTPQATEIDEETTIGQVGIYRPMDDSFTSKIAYGFQETWAIISGIIALLATVFTGGFSINNLGGPVAVYALTESVVSSTGLLGLLAFTASLSVNLGVVNLIPIPGLDGGKLVLNFVEAVRGEPVSARFETILTLISALFLLLLVVLVTWNDIQRFFF